MRTQAGYALGGHAPSFGHEFSNAGIIDYRPGVTFAGLFEAPTAVVDSKYCVNMDKSGNTVNMHIAQLGAAPVAQFAAPVPAAGVFHAASAPFSEPLSDVAARVACELCSDGLREQASTHEGRVAAEMQMHIQSLNDQLNNIKSSIAATSSPAHTAEAPDAEHLSAGLRNHTMVLRKTQKQLNSMQSELDRIGMQTLAHSSEIANMSAQTETHTEHLSAMNVGLLNHKDELQRIAASVADQPTSGSMHKFEGALANHRDEIRKLKTQPSVAEQLGTVQAQIDLLHEGLLNHKAVLSSKAESMRPSTTMQRSDLDGFMRLKQGR